jgi:hypothetical protein
VGADALFDEQAVYAILGFDWGRLGPWHEKRDDGIYLRPPDGFPVAATGVEKLTRLRHPSKDLGAPALPFPFTVGDFLAFCDSAPFFAWELESEYSNDPAEEGGPTMPDLDALDRLGEISSPSRRLVEAFLSNARHGLPYRGRQSQQEGAILKSLRQLGYDPEKLPRSRGVAGCKKRVRDALQPTPLFGGSKRAFDLAWDRLRAARSISDGDDRTST